MPLDDDKTLIDAISRTLSEAKDTGAAGREFLTRHFFYGDKGTYSYDKAGDYVCGTCKFADGDDCLLVKLGKKMDNLAGSCQHWEKVSGRKPPKTQYINAKQANYGVAKNGQGFGCKRCSWAERAERPDADGRPLFCNAGKCHVFEDACCGLNDVECY